MNNIKRWLLCAVLLYICFLILQYVDGMKTVEGFWVGPGWGRRGWRRGGWGWRGRRYYYGGYGGTYLDDNYYSYPPPFPY
jgi:hypothetical protein